MSATHFPPLNTSSPASQPLPSLSTKPLTVGDLLSIVVNALRHESLQEDEALRNALRKKAVALLSFNDRAPLSKENEILFDNLTIFFQTKGEVDQLARKSLLGDVPKQQSPFILIKNQIDRGKFDLAWSNLLIMLPSFFDTAKEADTAPLYDILAEVLPHLPLQAKEEIDHKIVHPLELLEFYPFKRKIQLNIAIANWLVNDCKKGVEREQWDETIYKPALELYGEALRLARKLQPEELPNLYRTASDLLSDFIYEQLPITGNAIDRAILREDQPDLESLLRQLILIRNTFCLTEREQSLLIEYYEKIAVFFGQHPLSDKSLVIPLQMGQQTDQNFPEPYVQRCDQALKVWESTFSWESTSSSQELFNSFPSLLNQLQHYSYRWSKVDGWTKGEQLLLPLLEISLNTSPISTYTLTKWLLLKESKDSFLTFATQAAGLGKELNTVALLTQGGIFANGANGELAIYCDFTFIQQDGTPDLEKQRLKLLEVRSWLTQNEKKPEAVTLINCAVLTALDLLPFLHKDLVSLDLRGSSIESIPPQITDCPIKKLYLTGCEKLTTFEQVVKFSQLEVLHIDHCRGLASIHLEACRLQELKISDNPKLSAVFLRGNILTEIDMRGSPQVSLEQICRNSYSELAQEKLDCNFSLTLGGYIDSILQNNGASEKKYRLGEGFLFFLEKHLLGSRWEYLETLHFYSSIGVAEATVLAAILPTTHLTSLYFRGKSIGPEEFKIIAKSFPATYITSLDLSDNSIGDEGAKALAAGLPPTLTELNLRNNSIGPEGAKAFALSLPSTLTSLNLSQNPIGDDGITAIAANLPPALTTLWIYGNSIGDNGTKALALGLPATLISLNLSSNSIGDDGITAIAANLPPALTTLWIYGNSIGDNGTKAFALSLPSSHLTTLYFSNNSIGNEGAKALASSLPPTLTYLDLDRNPIGDEGANAFALSLPSSRLTELHLDGTDIGAEGVVAITSALPATHLTRIHLWTKSSTIDTLKAIGLKNKEDQVIDGYM